MIDSLCAISGILLVMLSTRWLGRFLWRMQFSWSHLIAYLHFVNGNQGLHQTIRRLKRRIPRTHPLQLILHELHYDHLPRLDDRQRRTRLHIESMREWNRCLIDERESARLTREIPVWESVSQAHSDLWDAVVKPLHHIVCRLDTYAGPGSADLSPYETELVNATSALRAHLSNPDPLESDQMPLLSTP